MKRITLGVMLTMVVLPTSSAAGKVEVKVTPAMRPYCNIIRFPQGWIYPILATGPSTRPHQYDYNSPSDYEFRASGPVGTKFLISGVNILSSLPNNQFYTTNQYEIDLSDQKALPRPASKEAWQAGKAIPLSRNDLMARSPLHGDALFKFREHELERSGRRWSLYSSRLSPNQAWLALQSLTEVENYFGQVGSPFGGTGRYKGATVLGYFQC